MERAYIDLVEIKTMEQWKTYSTSISIVTLGLFSTTDVFTKLFFFMIQCEQYDSYERITRGKSNAVFFYTLLPELLNQVGIALFKIPLCIIQLFLV